MLIITTITSKLFYKIVNLIKYFLLVAPISQRIKLVKHSQ